jgi:putative nucleotidyltransferase with HDIG domain
VNRPSREEAWGLLTEYTQNQSLRRHALAVEATMRELARSVEIRADHDVETWGLVGMLHDFDYERHPTEQEHVWRGMAILRERGGRRSWSGPWAATPSTPASSGRPRSCWRRSSISTS